MNKEKLEFHHLQYYSSDFFEELAYLEDMNLDLFKYARQYKHIEQKNLDDEVEVETHIIYAYEHGMIAFSSTPFSCPWDSGKAGIIEIKKHLSDATKEAILERVIKLLNDYFNNDLWGIREDGYVIQIGSQEDCDEYAQEQNKEPVYVV